MNSPAESNSQTSDPQEVVISAIDVADFNTSSIPDESMVTITVYTAKSRASTSCNKATFINAFLPDFIEKKRLGRYSLIEAALMLERYANADPISMVEKLEHSVSTKVLTVFAPGKTDKYHSERVRDFYEEVYWDDLNVWLSTNEARITWRFPSPAKDKANDNSDERFLINDGDPRPSMEWYTPARFFARELIAIDSSLKGKKILLAEKVSQKMFESKIKNGRGQFKKLDSGTILKAFVNVNF